MKERVLTISFDSSYQVAEIIEDGEVVFRNIKLGALLYYIDHLQAMNWKIIQEKSIPGGIVYTFQSSSGE